MQQILTEGDSIGPSDYWVTVDPVLVYHIQMLLDA